MPEDLATRVAALPIMFAALDIVVVARRDASSTSSSVAAVHFRLGSRLGLHWLRDRIVALPRDDRWRARARAALRDDLYAIHREITSEVLRSAPADAEPDGARGRLDRLEPGLRARRSQTIGDIRGGQSYDLTTLPVAVREMRNLIAQPVSSSLTSHSRRAVCSSRAAPFGFTIFGCPRCSPMPVRADVGAALEARRGGGVERRQRAHLGALRDHRVDDLHHQAVHAAARRRSGGSWRRSPDARRGS